MFARRKRPGWHVWGNELANDVEMPNDQAQRPEASKNE
jgi:N6-adenosine-specific RNA methylase IME4